MPQKDLEDKPKQPDDNKSTENQMMKPQNQGDNAQPVQHPAQLGASNPVDAKNLTKNDDGGEEKT